MFTGLVQGVAAVQKVQKKLGLLTYTVLFPPHLAKDLKVGASVAVDGVCQSVMQIGRFNTKTQAIPVVFEAIGETLKRTTLNTLMVSQCVNLERALCIGDEIGGHLLSGHVLQRAQIKAVQTQSGEYSIGIQNSPTLSLYLFEKGFIAIDGISLTLGKVTSKEFRVHLIPLTLADTTLSKKRVGDWVNVEIDSQTQAIVHTVARLLKRKKLSSFEK